MICQAWLRQPCYPHSVRWTSGENVSMSLQTAQNWGDKSTVNDTIPHSTTCTYGCLEGCMKCPRVKMCGYGFHQEVQEIYDISL
jgi:hypothetical protein